MVSESEKSDFPRYSLGAMQALAEQGAVAYAGPNVERDVQNLQYNLDDVCQCICLLSASDFVESVFFDDTKTRCDVYHLKVNALNKYVDDLYIKLKLSKNCLLVVLCSFHRKRK